MMASDAAITASTAAWVTSRPIAGPTEVNCRSSTSAPNLALMASVSSKLLGLVQRLHAHLQDVATAQSGHRRVA